MYATRQISYSGALKPPSRSPILDSERRQRAAKRKRTAKLAHNVKMLQVRFTHCRYLSSASSTLDEIVDPCRLGKFHRSWAPRILNAPVGVHSGRILPLSGTSVMSTLPLELLNLIFSLVEDAATLCACSSVCYTWLQIGRAHV